MKLFLLQGDALGSYFWRMLSWFQIFLALVITFNTQVKAFGDSTQWQEVLALDQAGKYEEALRALEAQPLRPSLDGLDSTNGSGPEDSSYYYNLGTLNYRLGKLGFSLGYLEKANRILPHDPDIQSNLSLVRTTLSQKIGADALDPASTSLEQLADRISPNDAKAILGFLALVISLLWIRAYLETHSIKKAMRIPTGLLGLLGMAVLIIFGAIQHTTEATPPAISLERQVVRSGPGDHYVELAQLEEGSKVRVLSPPVPSSASTTSSQNTSSVPPSDPKVDAWSQIRYSMNKIGWIRASSLLTL